jgi:hypothetical protein
MRNGLLSMGGGLLTAYMAKKADDERWARHESRLQAIYGKDKDGNWKYQPPVRKESALDKLWMKNKDGAAPANPETASAAQPAGGSFLDRLWSRSAPEQPAAAPAAETTPAAPSASTDPDVGNEGSQERQSGMTPDVEPVAAVDMPDLPDMAEIIPTLPGVA